MSGLAGRLPATLTGLRSLLAALGLELRCSRSDGGWEWTVTDIATARDYSAGWTSGSERDLIDEIRDECATRPALVARLWPEARQ